MTFRSFKPEKLREKDHRDAARDSGLVLIRCMWPHARCVMLHLTFCIGPTRFVMDARRVSQVVARVPLRALPLSEPYVAGLLDFRGTVLAVVDLATLLFGTACASSLSTRIIIVRIKHKDREVPLGLIAEQVTELCQADLQMAEPPSSEIPEHDCLGRIVRIDGELAQLIEVDRVLPESARLRIFDHFLE
jgi:chemotaxis-related protein WspB